jgi:hypothetical protein
LSIEEENRKSMIRASGSIVTIAFSGRWNRHNILHLPVITRDDYEWANHRRGSDDGGNVDVQWYVVLLLLSL